VHRRRERDGDEDRVHGLAAFSSELFAFASAFSASSTARSALRILSSFSRVSFSFSARSSRSLFSALCSASWRSFS
jgi:hypothetical protein